MNIIVIDNKELVPSHYKGYVIEHEHAVSILKRDPYWQWRFESKTSEQYWRLKALSRDSGRTMDKGYKLEDHEFPGDLVRLGMGNHQFLLIRDDLTYEYFTPASQQD